MARSAQASRRPNTTKKPHIKANSKAKFNAAGYAKRQARKEKETALSEDVYEYAPDVVRRSKVKLDLDRDEDFGGIPDGDDEREQLRARLIGENEDDEMIDSEDDEDIDSDAAFEESDEDRFAGFFSRKVGTCHCFRCRLVEEGQSKDKDEACCTICGRGFKRGRGYGRGEKGRKRCR